MGYAKVSETVEGDVLVTDCGFTCMQPGVEKEVKLFRVPDASGGLYLDCQNGKHFLDGQINNHDEYVGLWKKGEEPYGEIAGSTT